MDYAQLGRRHVELARLHERLAKRHERTAQRLEQLARRQAQNPTFYAVRETDGSEILLGDRHLADAQRLIDGEDLAAKVCGKKVA